jgi:outer membrane protein OmpA-like peptidoglycan-associated protein
LAFVAGWLAAAPLAAQQSGFALDRLAPAPSSEDGLALVLPRTLQHLRPSFGLTLDYAHQPLVIARAGDDPNAALVKHRFVGHATAALGLGTRAELFVRVPVLFAQRGDSQTLGLVSRDVSSSSAFGMVSLGGGVRIAGEDDGPLQLGATAWLELPSGREAALSKDDGVGFAAVATGAAHIQGFSFAVNAGGRYRPDANYGSSRIGSELLLAVGAYAHVGDKLTFLGELNGAIALREVGHVAGQAAPLELLAGVRHSTPFKVSLTGAVGLGLTHAVGVPDVRALLQVGYPNPRTPLKPADDDRDAVPDSDDACPQREEDRDGFHDEDGCPDLDNDQDGTPDTRDQCSDAPEDMDGFQDEDGCPDPDNDADEIPDERDPCASAAEDVDGFQDEDGCPDFDNDQDGLLDQRDQCPLEPEDGDGFTDEDGCPDLDNDKDEVADVDDGCPTVPGPAASKGCPSAVRIDKAQIRILQRIEFQSQRTEVSPASLAVLDQVRSALAANPQIKRVRVEGHTDNRGTALANQNISQRRAEAVVAYLVRQGVEPSRLEAKGWGDERPLVKNDSEANMQINRRVEFHIVDPAPPSSTLGGQQP